MLCQQKEQEGVEKSPHPTDSEVWVPGYLTPSWVSLPNEKPVLAIIEPGHTALYTLESVCKVRPVCYTKCCVYSKDALMGDFSLTLH